MPPVEVPQTSRTPSSTTLSALELALDRQRAVLMDRYQRWKSRADAFNQTYVGHEFDEGSKEAKDGADEQAWLTQEGEAYQRLANAFNARVGKLVELLHHERSMIVVPIFTPGCKDETDQFERERAQIVRSQEQLSGNQQELDESTENGRKAMIGGAKAAIVFLAGSYADDLEDVKERVGTLEEKAGLYAARATNVAKSPSNRLEYLNKLKAVTDELRPLQSALLTKSLAEAATSLDQGWTVSRQTMNNSFRVAAKHNQAMRDLLRDPGFKKAFTGDDIDMPTQEVIAALTDEALAHAATFEEGLKKYSSLTGPTVRIGTFVRDTAYDGLLLYFSGEQVSQRSDIAANLAKAAGILQDRYKTIVDTLRACKAQR
jgi:hypothetical protein